MASSLLPSNYSALFSETTFNREEANVLQIFQCHVNESIVQINTIKNELSFLNHEMKEGKNYSFDLYNIFKQKQITLQNLNQNLRSLYNAIISTNQNAIVSRQKCESYFDELEVERNTLKLRLENSQQSLIKKEKQLENVSKKLEQAESAARIKTYEALNATAENMDSIRSDIISTFGWLMKLVPQKYEMSVFIYVFTWYCKKDTEEYLKQCKILGIPEMSKQKDIIAGLVIQETDEKNMIVAEMQKLTEKLQNTNELLQNQKSKLEVFQMIIRVLCDVQNALIERQNPLNRLICVYESYFQPPSNLVHIVEREKNKLAEKVMNILNEIQFVHDQYELEEILIRFICSGNDV